MFGSGCHIDLKRETSFALNHAMMDVLDGFEPRHPFVVDMVSLVVEDGELIDLADDLTKVRLRIGGLAGRLGPKGVVEKIIAKVFVIDRRFRYITQKHTMNIREKKVPCGAQNTHIVLNVQSELKVVPPVTASMTIFRKNWVIEENFEAIEIRAKAVKNDDVRSNEKEIASQRGIRFVKLMEVAPGDK